MPNNPTSKKSIHSYATLVLVVGMLVSGVCNTILNKFQDMQCVRNCEDPDPKNRVYFEQPIWQTLNMFVGEFAVWSVYLYQKYQQRKCRLEPAPPSAVNQLDASVIVDEVDQQITKTGQDLPELEGWKALLFWIPTLCDLAGTTVMNVGLLLISASVYQMLRGAVVIFTGLFSYMFLNRRLRTYEWFSLVMVVFGVSIVGLSSVLFPQKKPDSVIFSTDSVDYKSLIGVTLVLGAQLFTASQFVIEEKILVHYKVTPLKAVGLEGSFGLISVLGAMPILHVILGKHHDAFDIVQGYHDFFGNPTVWQTGLAISCSIAFFNWFGLSITSTVSATARSTIDACRTLFIWMVSLYLGWEKFSWVQVVGFAVMVTGTFYFNGVFKWPFVTEEDEEGERERLLPRDE
ncbi:Solute carrier family 35 member F6 [Choanephora cucurbitarum]|uniref:Solute carrier family 35 member F6 n=1 Tax=Choanephora cucurbitarum TaxID=101091 RepID=A0A1C7NDH7_9FUNG|nr:Solute carrier family 35 member F6 [Choanephora cucurbitarum]